LKGNWVVSSSYLSRIRSDKSEFFSTADSKCFEGSTWKFISNNNKGNMALTAITVHLLVPITWLK
jgi:hypothetical protein